MVWWKFWEPESEEERLQKETVIALEHGDIPPIARRRIDEQLKRGSNSFSSDLSVREFLLMKESGIEPISQVMGASFFNVSYFGSYTGSFRYTSELTDITHAQMAARRLAMNRMKIEAQLLGAHGVIGVRINTKKTDLGSRHSEFTAYGTAVRVPGMQVPTEPFTSTLNGQEFWQLYKAGYMTKAVLMGACSYYVYTDWRTSWQTSAGLFGNYTNQEVDKYTDCFIAAREISENRLQSELALSGADGVVDVKLGHEIEEIEYESGDSRQRDLLINFFMMGTAIQRASASPNHQQPKLLIDLTKNKSLSTKIDL